MSKSIKGFYQFTKASYYDSLKDSYKGKRDEITFGLYCLEGGTEGEMTIHWDDKDFIYLKVHNDAWRALAACSEIVTLLASFNGKNVEPNVVAQHFIDLGYAPLHRVNHISQIDLYIQQTGRQVSSFTEDDYDLISMVEI